MRFTEDQVSKLSGKLSRSHVKQRAQGGGSVSYIEGWHAVAEANRIFGFGGWDQKADYFNLVQEEAESKKGQSGEYLQWRVSYTCVGSITAGEVSRTDVGFGQGIDKDKGKAHESAIKEAATDMVKRCLRTFGDPFGLALYDKQQTNVENVSNAPAARTVVAPRAPAPSAETNGRPSSEGSTSAPTASDPNTSKDECLAILDAAGVKYGNGGRVAVMAFLSHGINPPFESIEDVPPERWSNRLLALRDWSRGNKRIATLDTYLNQLAQSTEVSDGIVS